jgi:hypothetical protein
MIDTIKGYLVLDNKKYSDFEYLFINESRKTKEDGFTITFNLSNFRITIKFNNKNEPINLRFNGSLPKFYFGNNLAQLDWDTTKEAIQMLSDNLDVDMNEAILTRIDFGINFIVPNSIHRYISCLVNYPRLEKIQFKDSVTFYSKTGPKSLIFYDKLKEIKNNDKNAFYLIPEMYRNQNILRYEIRLVQLLKHELKSSHIQIKDLYNNTLQKKMKFIWLEGYEKTNKLSIGTDPLHLLNGHNGILKYLSYHGIDKISYDRIINSINDLNFDVKNPSVKRSKMKAIVNELLKGVKENTLDENLVKEMDDKIRLIKAFIS